MKTQLAQPQPETSGPRYPRIRVSHSDPFRDAPEADYLDTFAFAMERAFLIAFRNAERGFRL